jgi:hypothetical protein
MTMVRTYGQCPGGVEMKKLITCFVVFILNYAVVAQAPLKNGSGELPFNIAATDSNEGCVDCCGTEMSQEYLSEIERMVQDGSWDNATNNNFPQPRGIQYVKTTFHILRYADGSGGLETSRCQLQIDYLNSHLEGGNLVFCISNILFHDLDNPVVTYPTGPYIGYVQGTMNVYCTPYIEHTFGLCGYASYPTGTTFVVQNNCMDYGEYTFSHEAGHYFGLPHTFDGTEDGSNPECVDGSNCSTAGDYICDTPADDNGGWNFQCGYIGGGVDVCNETPYAPSAENIMSYAPDACTTEFSPNQQSLFLYMAQTYRADILSDEMCPTTTGACCIEQAGACIEIEGFQCLDGGGDWQGAGTYCADGCLQNELGACCIEVSQACIEIYEPTCVAGGGVWLGPLTVCADEECAFGCEGDTNGDGEVNVTDLLEVVDQWGNTSGSADINTDGIVDVSDLLIVVGSWGPCE